MMKPVRPISTERAGITKIAIPMNPLVIITERKNPEIRSFEVSATYMVSDNWLVWLSMETSVW